mmetsp:Transcript_38349/g.57862  ORF Transcript_38349/g.57862 Transcript_38349/m.57862 type:complete len:89 (-) Transcript_38349:147-413(-)
MFNLMMFSLPPRRSPPSLKNRAASLAFYSFCKPPLPKKKKKKKKITQQSKATASSASWQPQLPSAAVRESHPEFDPGVEHVRWVLVLL